MTARTLLMSSVAGGGAFNPETDITWHSLFWGEGSGMNALGYADLANVTTWPNETGETDATQATIPPVFTASSPSFNSRPVVRFVGAADRLDATPFSVAPSYASGVTLVVIGRTDTPGSSNQFFVDGSTFGARNAMWFTTSGYQLIAGGTEIVGATLSDANPHLLLGFFDGGVGNEFMQIDGAAYSGPSDAGPEQLTGIRMGSLYNGSSFRLRGDIALLGIYEGDFTLDPLYADFTAWAELHYGFPIA